MISSKNQSSRASMTLTIPKKDTVLLIWRHLTMILRTQRKLPLDQNTTLTLYLNNYMAVRN